MASWMKNCLLGLTTAICLLSVAQGNMNCMLGIETEMKRCFADAGIDLNSPEYRIEGNNQNGMVFDSVMTQKPEMFCKKVDKTKQAINCLVEHIESCLPSNFQGFIPKGESLGRAIDELCQNEREVNFQCVGQMSKALFNCGQSEAKRYIEEHGQPSGVQEMFCLKGNVILTCGVVFSELKEWFHAHTQVPPIESYNIEGQKNYNYTSPYRAYKLNPVCQKKVLKKCGCMTSKVYSDISFDILYPASCPRISPRRVICHETNKLAFVDDGIGNGSGKPSVFIWNLVVTSLLAVASKLY